MANKSGKATNRRNKLKRYLRYHHFFSHPAKESHAAFMGVLSLIDEYADNRLCEGGKSVEESWSEILAAANSVPDEDLEDILRFIRNSKPIK